MKTTMPMLTREASFEPRTWNDESRTVEVVWTTGARIRRHDWLDGDFDEELEISEEAVDMGRLTSGRAPLLAAHSSRSLRDILGVVESAWILGPNGRKEGRAKVRFSDREDVAPVLADVRNGILKNVSVGYSVSKWEKRQIKGDEVPVMRATRWHPMELSLVPMGADAAAQVRGRPETYATMIEDINMDVHVADPAVLAAAYPVSTDTVTMTVHGVSINGGNGDPPKPAPEPAPAPEPVPEPEPATAAVSAQGDLDLRAIAQEGAQAERTRAAGINLTTRKLLLDQRHADKLIAAGTSLDVARDQLIGIWADSQKGNTVDTPVNLVRDEGETRVRALTDAILYRVNHLQAPTEVTTQFGYQYFRLLDIARECLELRGVRTRAMAPSEIARQAMLPDYTRVSGGLHTTSDFANVLQSTINTTLRQAYDQAPPTFQAWARQTTVPDYRSVSRVQLSGAGRLQSVGEHGEYKRGTLSDSKEAYQVIKYGQIIGVTREVIINDYLDVFGRIPSLMAASARALESDIVYKQLLANANMADGVALFNATHGNDDAAAVISTTSLGTGYTLMALQTNANGAPMNLTPSYLLVPPGIRATAEQQINGTITPAQVSNAVPAYMRGLTVITEARLHTGVTVDGVVTAGDANGWFLVASPTLIDTVEYAYLEGSTGVYTETRNGFDIDGVEIKVRLDFGAKAIDWRGMVRNTGA